MKPDSAHAAVVVFLLAMALLFAVTWKPARAHGDAQWIMDGDYKAKDGNKCCDEKDCLKYPAARFRKTVDGIWFTSDEGKEYLMPWTDRNRGLHGSENSEWWACLYRAPGGVWMLRCVFVPPGRGT